MSKESTIRIRDQWLAFEDLELPSGFTTFDLEELVTPSPIRISLEVILPKGCPEPKFDFNKNADVKKFRTFLETKCSDAMRLVLDAHHEDEDGDEEKFKAAESAIKKINGLVKKSIGDFRVLLRTAIAKIIGGSVSADDLMTIGSMAFKEFSLVPGAFQGEDSFDSPLLDLSKGLKRKKWQYIGIAWKSADCVVSIKPKKEFTSSELKELRDLLPSGAKAIGGRIKAFSETDIIIELTEGKHPKLLRLKEALHNQTNKTVQIGLVFVKKEVDPKQSADGNKKTDEGNKEDKKNSK